MSPFCHNLSTHDTPAAGPSPACRLHTLESRISLNILHILSSIAPEAGGPPVVAAGLAGALAARGHAVTIATVASPTQIALPAGVTLKSFPPDSSPRYAKSAALNNWLEATIRQFDVAHLHSLWQFPTYAAARACQRHGVPYLSLLHGMLDHYSVHHRSYWLKRVYWLYREKNVQANAAALHCLNPAEIRRAVPWIRNDPKVIVPNGISEAEIDHLPARGLFRAQHPHLTERPIALFLSRLHPKKGLDRLIPAWKSLASKMPEAALVIAGAGDPTYTALLDQLIVQNNLQQHIFRVGQLTGEKKWQALVDADIFVLPSHQEGFSMAITEALAASLPVVVTEECNFDDLQESGAAPGQPHGGGIIIRHGDMSAFMAAVESLLHDPAQRTAMGHAGAALVRARFTWPQIAAQMEHIYHLAIAKHPFTSSGRL